MAVRSAEVIYSLRRREHVEYFGGEASEDEDYVEEEEDDSSSEQECDGYSSADSEDNATDEAEPEQEKDTGTGRKYIYGKDKTKWSRKPVETRGRRSGPLTMHFATPTPQAMNVTTPLESWNLFFTDTVIDTIVQHSNEERERKLQNMSDDSRERSSFRAVDAIAVRAFIGLLFYAGILAQRNSLLAEIWSTDYGMNLFVSTMSVQRFEFISSILRFDDRSTRAERRATDVLASIREIWDLFIEQCKSNYSPSNNVSIDEQLLGFRGKFSARVYIKSKPARYGLKIVCINDAQTFYMVNAIPYAGKVECARGEKVPEYYLRVLSEPIWHTGRTITFDNWFTTINACNLMKNERGLDVVGTIRKNKREIPTSFVKPAAVGSSRYAYDHSKKITLLSFTPKRNKLVLLVSGIHRKGVTGYSGKPEMIEFYNATKGGVDTFDKMISSYTVARKTNRWPLRLFFGMLDQSAINAFVVHNLLQRNEVLTRLNFLKKLSLQLVFPHLKRRIDIPGLHRFIRMSIHQILGTNEITHEHATKPAKRKRCSLCAHKEDRKTNECCARCGKPVCEDHRINLCSECT